MPAAGVRTNGFPVVADASLRWSRALLLSGTAWATASAAHLIGDRQLPSAPAMLVLVIAAAWPLSLLLSRRAGALRMVIALAGAQFAMHVAFVIGAWLTMTPASPWASTMSGHDMNQAGPVPMADPAIHEMSLIPENRMLVAHFTAALVLGLALAAADRRLFTVLGILAGRVRAGTSRIMRVVLGAITTSSGALIGQRLPMRRHDDGSPPDSRLLQPETTRAIPRRGPPRVAQALA